MSRCIFIGEVHMGTRAVHSSYISQHRGHKIYCDVLQCCKQGNILPFFPPKDSNKLSIKRTKCITCV